MSWAQGDRERVEEYQQRRHRNRMGIVPQIPLPGTELGPEINVMGCGHLIILSCRWMRVEDHLNTHTHFLALSDSAELWPYP